MNSKSNEVDASKSTFSKLFLTGLLGWVVGSLLLFGAAWPLGPSESASTATMWAISHWWIAFLFGAILLVVRGLISRLSIGTALFAYILPAASLMAVVGICLAIYPDRGFRSDLFSYIPLILIFYILGFLWMTFAPKDSEKSTFLRAVLPAVIGGIIVLGLVTVPVFRSYNFIYRNAFGLVVTKNTVSNGTMTAHAVLEIRKPGNYDFVAPRYSPYNGEESVMDTSVELGKITWGAAGIPKEGVPGTYPLQIRWEKNIRDVKSDPSYPTFDEDVVYLEVRDPSDASKELMFNISATMPTAQ